MLWQLIFKLVNGNFLITAILMASTVVLFIVFCDSGDFGLFGPATIAGMLFPVFLTISKISTRFNNSGNLVLMLDLFLEILLMVISMINGILCAEKKSAIKVILSVSSGMMFFYTFGTVIGSSVLYVTRIEGGFVKTVFLLGAVVYLTLFFIGALSDYFKDTELEHKEVNKKGYSYTLMLCHYRKGYDGNVVYNPLGKSAFNDIKKILKESGKVLKSKRNKDSFYFEGIFDSLQSVARLNTFLSFFKHKLTISNYSINSEIEDKNWNLADDEYRFGYYLTISRMLSEKPNEDLAYAPLIKNDSELIKETLEDCGEVLITEERDHYTFFKGYFDLLEYLESFDDVFDPSSKLYYDLTITDMDHDELSS